MISDDEKTRLINRLRRVGGQVEAVARMVEQDSYCVETLMQLSAIMGALSRVGQIVLESHLKTCVRSAMQGGDAAEIDRKLEELVAIFHKYAHVVD